MLSCNCVSHPCAKRNQSAHVTRIDPTLSDPEEQHECVGMMTATSRLWHKEALTELRIEKPAHL